ncbi:clusterin [Bombina bombina]|uniref:clusterin n=1 Tax=Bombina bombina TaxID=8345 RepID=UPI00235A557E|nr:clusterin [Bombina bombina]
MYLSHFLFAGLLLCLSDAILSPENMKQLSADGSKYITTQFENALDGVKKMKLLMDKTGQEHQEIIHSLDESKRNKEEAAKQALETEQQLSEVQEVCNDTMLALWEECKPCLKQTCVKFYTKTCSSGSGLVGRRFEEFLNRSSPFSVLFNGEKLDNLAREDEQQHLTLGDLEDGYSILEGSVDEIFHESIKAFEHMQSLFPKPYFGRLREPQRNIFPFQRPSFPISSILIRKERSPLFGPYFSGNFESLFEAARKMMERTHELSRQQATIFDAKDLFEGTRNATEDKMVCRELRRNSAGCLKLRDKCEKCKEILAIDCSGKDSAQKFLQEKFEESLQMVEQFTQQYEDLLTKFREKMLNTTSYLEELNQQFGWVSKLANITQNDKSGIFQISTVFSKSTEGGDPTNTTVSVKLFDSEPFTFTVPGNITMDDTDFGELVAEEALKRFKTQIIEAV